MSTENEGKTTVQSSEDNTQKTAVTKSPEELQKIIEDKEQWAKREAKEKKEATERAEKAESEANNLRKQLEEAQDSKGDVSNANITKIAEQFDVDPKFAEALAEAISSKNSSEIKKAREELQSEISKRDAVEKQKAFDEAFDKAFTKATEGIKTTVNKDAVKTVFLDRVKNNQELTIDDVVTEMYGSSGRSSSEDDVRGGGEGNGIEIDFTTASRDAKQLKAIMADPTAKAKYYAWRDKQGL